MTRDRDFRINQAQRHAPVHSRETSRHRAGSGLARKEVQALRASEHDRDLVRFYRGED